MAAKDNLSKFSSLKGQKVLTCRLCETDPKVKWKCFECKLVMCHRCREKVHSKFASASDHTIIDIKDPESDFSKFKCGEHSGKQCWLFCEWCDILVCSTCVAKTHKGHELVEIEEEYQKKAEKVVELKLNLSKMVESLKDDEQARLRKTRYLHQHVFESTNKAIENQKQAMIKAAEENAQDLFDENDTNYNKVLGLIESQERQVEETIKTAEKRKEELDNLLSMHDTTKNIFTEKDSLNLACYSHEQQTLSHMLSTMKFVPGDLTCSKLQIDKLSELNTTPNIVKIYNTSLRTCYYIIDCGNQTFWLNDYKDNCLQKVSLNFESIQTLQELNIFARASLLKSGNLLLAIERSPVLKILPIGSKDLKDSMCDVSPYQPGSIHVDINSKKVIVACSKTVETGTKIWLIVIMNKAGHREKVYKFDGEPSFVLPYSISCTSQSCIGVVDLVAEKRGRVILLDQNGVKNIYIGNNSFNNKENLFFPINITATPSDNFVVTDSFNFLLHVLNEEGDLLTLIETRTIGIEQQPLCLCFARNVYIGCYGNKEQGAKIYELENFVW